MTSSKEEPAGWQPKGPERYGRFYWCIKTNDLSLDGEIYVHADIIRVAEDGSLELYGRRTDGQEGLNLLIAKGDWRAVYAASVIDGSAVAVQHWAGEVVREPFESR